MSRRVGQVVPPLKREGGAVLRPLVDVAGPHPQRRERREFGAKFHTSQQRLADVVRPRYPLRVLHEADQVVDRVAVGGQLDERNEDAWSLAAINQPDISATTFLTHQIGIADYRSPIAEELEEAGRAPLEAPMAPQRPAPSEVEAEAEAEAAQRR